MAKRFIIIMVVLLTLASCGHDDKTAHQADSMDYKQEMRNWVMLIGDIAKSKNQDFLIIPQNCSPLFTNTGYADGQINAEFIESIDGVGQEGISYGNNRYNIARDIHSKTQITDLLNIGVKRGLTILSVNYCSISDNINDAIENDQYNGYISFVSNSLELTDAQPNTIINENKQDISSLDDAKNWLLLLNPEKHKTKEDYINALCATNYDVLVIDAFFYDDIMLSLEDVKQLKIKDNGARRIVISYLSIGEAEDYRYYWTDEYKDNSPEWLLNENPNWEGNYPVEYWHKEWQEIIATGDNSYLNRIIEAGFDGVYLDIVDGYQIFEDMLDE